MHFFVFSLFFYYLISSSLPSSFWSEIVLAAKSNLAVFSLRLGRRNRFETVRQKYTHLPQGLKIFKNRRRKTWVCRAAPWCLNLQMPQKPGDALGAKTAKGGRHFRDDFGTDLACPRGTTSQVFCSLLRNIFISDFWEPSYIRPDIADGHDIPGFFFFFFFKGSSFCQCQGRWQRCPELQCYTF